MIKHLIIHIYIYIYELLGASFRGVKILFVLAYDAKDDDNTGIKNNQNNFLQKAENENCNVLIDERNFYDLPINDLIKDYDDIMI